MTSTPAPVATTCIRCHVDLDVERDWPWRLARQRVCVVCAAQLRTARTDAQRSATLADTQNRGGRG